jgi:hypothetical protein
VHEDDPLPGAGTAAGWLFARGVARPWLHVRAPRARSEPTMRHCAPSFDSDFRSEFFPHFSTRRGTINGIKGAKLQAYNKVLKFGCRDHRGKTKCLDARSTRSSWRAVDRLWTMTIEDAILHSESSRGSSPVLWPRTLSVHCLHTPTPVMYFVSGGSKHQSKTKRRLNVAQIESTRRQSRVEPVTRVRQLPFQLGVVNVAVAPRPVPPRPRPVPDPTRSGTNSRGRH